MKISNRSLQAGGQGYLLKDMFFNELEEAVRKVHADCAAFQMLSRTGSQKEWEAPI